MKRFFTIISMLLVLTMIPLSLFSCNSGSEPTQAPTEAPAGEPTEKPTAKPTEKPTQKPTETENPYADEKLELTDYYFDDEDDAVKVKHIGRTMHDSDKGICCDHTASGIEFNAVVEGDIELEVVCEAVNDNEAYLTVFIDGVRMEDTYEHGKRTSGNCRVSAGTKTVTIAEDLEKGLHNIRILKQTESNYSLVAFKTLTMEGYLTDKPADKELYIEFIGDSLTCGMGNAGNNTISGAGSAQGMNGADWEDGTQGYAFLTAEELGADCSIVSESGNGITGSWFKPEMPIHYFKTSYRRDTSADYDFARVPDLIVINLGTNDHFLNIDKAEYKGKLIAKIREATKAYIEDIREAYGEDVPILWVSGVWNGCEDVVDEIDLAVQDMGGEEAGIYRLTVTYTDENKAGAEGHPSLKGHLQLKEEVVEYIESKNILN